MSHRFFLSSTERHPKRNFLATRTPSPFADPEDGFDQNRNVNNGQEDGEELISDLNNLSLRGEVVR